MTTTEADVFDFIHRELDSVPPETWTEDEAWQVLAVLVDIRRARNALARPCVPAGEIVDLDSPPERG